jgi:extradiol dioxygenase family protein
MSRPFHLAIPAGDLDVAVSFYQNILGCKLGNKEEGKWVDVDFWGNELTLHKTLTKLPKERHNVDMGSVSVPHFGVHLEKQVFEKIKRNIKTNNIKYFDKPYVRFKGKEEEQETFF